MARLPLPLTSVLWLDVLRLVATCCGFARPPAARVIPARCPPKSLFENRRARGGRDQLIGPGQVTPAANGPRDAELCPWNGSNHTGETDRKPAEFWRLNARRATDGLRPRLESQLILHRRAA